VYYTSKTGRHELTRVRGTHEERPKGNAKGKESCGCRLWIKFKPSRKGAVVKHKQQEIHKSLFSAMHTKPRATNNSSGIGTKKNHLHGKQPECFDGIQLIFALIRGWIQNFQCPINNSRHENGHDNQEPNVIVKRCEPGNGIESFLLAGVFLTFRHHDYGCVVPDVAGAESNI
jgi:hypothetical protein